MPGWISPDDMGTIIQDLQSRVRRLESYNAAPLYASSVLLTDIASVQLTANNFGFATSWTTAYTVNFTLSAQQTILCVYQQSFYSTGGTANYVYVGQNVDANSNQAGGISVHATGDGVSNSSLLYRAASLPAGNHNWYGLYRMDAGATTTYNTVSATSGLHPQIDIYIIGA